MNKYLALLMMVVSSVAVGAVTLTETPGDWPLYQGTTIISRHPTYEACRQAIKDRNNPRTYSCRTTITVVATACPARPPGDSRLQQCPAGTTGSWGQTRTYLESPTSCWVLGEWSPAVAPADACAMVAPPVGSWIQCAVEAELCAYSGIRLVRYGSGTTFVTREQPAVDGGIRCDNETFGDPTPGVWKRCEISSSTTEPPPPVAGSATISWRPVMVNTDGSVLSNLSGYRVYYGIDNLSQSVVLSPTATQATVGGLSSGRWQFAVTAFTPLSESAFSDLGFKVLP